MDVVLSVYSFIVDHKDNCDSDGDDGNANTQNG